MPRTIFYCRNPLPSCLQRLLSQRQARIVETIALVELAHDGDVDAATDLLYNYGLHPVARDEPHGVTRWIGRGQTESEPHDTQCDSGCP
jgi:hypothetical protein